MILIFAALRDRKADHAAPRNRTRALVYGALCVALSFVLSYIKLFSLPMGGSLTLCSMLPIAAYACVFGPAYGFAAGFAYSLLQIIQGAWVVHWAQFLLDYIFAFTCYGIPSLFPKKLIKGLTVAGLARLLFSGMDTKDAFSSISDVTTSAFSRESPLGNARRSRSDNSFCFSKPGYEKASSEMMKSYSDGFSGRL